MQCLGRTTKFRRCKIDSKWGFCYQHKWQPLAGAFSVFSIIAVFAGLYQDLWKPVFKRPPQVVSKQVPVEHRKDETVPREIDKRIVHLVDDYLVLNTLNDPARNEGYDKLQVYDISDHVKNLPKEAKLVFSKSMVDLRTGENGKIFAALHSANEFLLKNVIILARYYYPKDQFSNVSSESHYRSEMQTIREAYLRSVRVSNGDLGTDHHALSLLRVQDFLIATVSDLILKIAKHRSDIDYDAFMKATEDIPNHYKGFNEGRINQLNELKRELDVNRDKQPKK